MSQEVETKFYTLEEVRIHNGNDDNLTWIIYKDVVYDVTEFLNEHPGGADLIAEYAGLDATKAFDDFGHSGDAKKQMKGFKIGEIVEDQRKGKSKKKPEVKNINTADQSKKPTTRSFFSIITCGLCS